MSEKINKIKIISPFRNASAFIENSIVSMLNQDYEDYEILVIDDASTDDSFSKLPSVTYETNEDGSLKQKEDGNYIIKEVHPLLKKTKCKNFMAWRSSQRLTALPNIYNAMTKWNIEPEDIVVICDTDDFLIGKNVLSYVNTMYNNGLGGINKIVSDEELEQYPENIRKTNEVLMTYGSASWSNGQKCFSRPYTKEEFRHIKSAQYKVSHLRTFKAKVFFEIIKQDPDLNCFKDEKGDWFQSGYDTAIWIPMLQICGYEHTFHNTKPIYFYNLHQNNDHVVNQNLQWDVHEQALKKRDFKQIIL